MSQKQEQVAGTEQGARPEEMTGSKQEASPEDTEPITRLEVQSAMLCPFPGGVGPQLQHGAYDMEYAHGTQMRE